MPTSTVYGDTHFPDRLSAGQMSLPANTVDNAAVEGGAAISATKLQHQHVLNLSQIVAADTVVAGTFLIHVCRGAGTIMNVEVSSETAPDADTDFFTVDVNIVTDGVSVSALTGIITYNNTNALAGDGGDVNGNYGIVTGTIDGANDDFTNNDIIEVIVAETNDGGTNASGLIITVTIREQADEP